MRWYCPSCERALEDSAEDEPDAPRVVYRTPAALGESEDMLIGSLTYLPAVVAAGTVVASAGIVAAFLLLTVFALGVLSAGIHELGHAVGLAHPHDSGGESSL